ncbi:MAG: LysR family transcriptional regulator [Rhizobiaceae bacterium]|nr:LysR family transcriptional regulator [Rhizobiaceae bacterium]MCZ8352650.1 LysR family transcriptional regulator [Rhizobium sp.]
MDLNLLLVFEALEKARSVSGAAKLLGLSQPATSAALSRLRRSLSDELFTYSAGAMQPTPTAIRLAPVLSRALTEIREAIEQQKTFDARDTRRTFVIGVTDYASAVIGPTLLAQVGTEAPGVDLRLQAYEKAEIGTLLEQAAFDVAIGTFGDPPARAVVTPLFQERFVGVARIGHPALGKLLDPKHFAELDHALFTLGRDNHGVIDDALLAIGLRRRVRLSVAHLMSLPEILRSTDLVACVPSRAATRMGPDIGTFPLDFLELTPWTVQMLWSPVSRQDPAHIWLRQSLKHVSQML